MVMQPYELVINLKDLSLAFVSLAVGCIMIIGAS